VNKKKVFAKVAGSGSYPLKFAVVLVMGHGYKDTPSVKYSIMRGKYDCATLHDKTKQRSLFCLKNPYVIYISKKNKKKKCFNNIQLYQL
jgi:ribosomal protein S12